jgi:DNA-binding CsgD family transcriptional regulator
MSPFRESDPPRSLWAPDPARSRLSAREREIALRIADWQKDAASADRAGPSAPTVATHVRRIPFRLSVKGHPGLIAWVTAHRAVTIRKLACGVARMIA